MSFIIRQWTLLVKPDGVQPRNIVCYIQNPLYWGLLYRGFTVYTQVPLFKRGPISKQIVILLLFSLVDDISLNGQQISHMSSVAPLKQQQWHLYIHMYTYIPSVIASVWLLSFIEILFNHKSFVKIKLSIQCLQVEHWAVIWVWTVLEALGDHLPIKNWLLTLRASCKKHCSSRSWRKQKRLVIYPDIE